ncbi:MAG: DUF4105 domain-containing protein [Proteobacteria bacterium]|nr:MAG: DUF4105 domain-containing protein [Pseudomonadota bacterium]
MQAKTWLTAAVIATVFGISSNVFAGSQMTAQMTAQMLFKNAPVPTSSQLKDLRFFADQPGDSVVTVQRPSLNAVDASAALLSKSQIEQAFGAQIGAGQAAQVLSSGYRVFGNFVDGLKGKPEFAPFNAADPSELWQVIIPNRTTVNETILQLEWFRTSIGGHAQIRFKLSNPLLLVSQDDGRTKFVDGDVIYALMALKTQNGSQNWNAVTGLTGAFASSYMLATSQHMAHRQLRADDSSFVEQYRLRLTSAQMQNMFSYALTVGPRVGEREIYNLIYNSCIQAALRAIKTVDARVDHWEFNPYNVVPELQGLGLISEQLPSANDEFQSPVRTLQDPSNLKTLALVEKLRGVMATSIFSQSLRSLAAVIIEDRWTTVELNAVLQALKESKNPPREAPSLASTGWAPPRL